KAGEAGFGYFEFSQVGVPLVVGAIAAALLFGRRLIPDREPVTASPDLGDHARTLIEHYGLGEWEARLEIPKGSPLIGQTAARISGDENGAVRVTEVTGKIGSIDLATPMPEGAV